MTHLSFAHRLLAFALLLAIETACQGEQDVAPTVLPSRPITAIPFSQALTLAPPVETTNTPLPARPTTTGPTVTSPVQTTSPAPSPQASTAPFPDPTSYLAESGDTLVIIADKFGVTLDVLLYANGIDSPEEFTLFPGTEVEIPLCEAYRVMPGNTLGGIAALCDISLDQLLTANIRSLAPLGGVEALPAGFVLLIPDEAARGAEPDCSLQPVREQVIEYSPAAQEGIFCLSQSFGISMATIIQANVQRLTGDNIYGDVALLLPPQDGALLTISADELAAGVTLELLGEWYRVSPETIKDWNGNSATAPLMSGQQLFLPGAYLLAGPYRILPDTTEEESG